MTGKSHGYTVPKVFLTSNNACITASTTPKGHTVIQIIIILQCNCLSRFYWGKLESVYGPLKTISFFENLDDQKFYRHKGYLNTDTRFSYTY